MPNQLITPTWVAREVLRVAANNLKFAGQITKMLSDDFKVNGTKVGASVQVRLPWRVKAEKGQALVLQGLKDETTTITITDQVQVGFGWSSFSATLEIEDARKRYVDPSAIQIANKVDADGLARMYLDVFNTVGTPATVPNANSTYFDAGAKMSNFAVPPGPRIAVINPIMRATIANANTGNIFNPQPDLSKIWRTGMFSGPALGFDEWYEDQNVFPHTVGPLGGTPLVNGASQTGASLITDGWIAAAANRVKRGDRFTLTSVNAVNPQNYNSTTQLQEFVVTADTDSDGAGNATIPISPPIVTSGAYQTVTASPADNAALTMKGAASAVTPQGLAFHPEAFVLASSDLVMPKSGTAERVRAPQLGLALRLWMDSDIMSDQHITRLDGIYGYKAQRPEFALVIYS